MMKHLSLTTGFAALLCCAPAVVSQAASKPAKQAEKKAGVPVIKPAQKKAAVPAMKLRAMPLSKQKAKTSKDLTKLYEEALAEPFVKKGSWMIDYDAARAKAKKEGKFIFAYFTRSYAY